MYTIQHSEGYQAIKKSKPLYARCYCYIVGDNHSWTLKRVRKKTGLHSRVERPFSKMTVMSSVHFLQVCELLITFLNTTMLDQYCSSMKRPFISVSTTKTTSSAIQDFFSIIILNSTKTKYMAYGLQPIKQTTQQRQLMKRETKIFNLNKIFDFYSPHKADNIATPVTRETTTLLFALQATIYMTFIASQGRHDSNKMTGKRKIGKLGLMQTKLIELILRSCMHHAM